MFPRSVYHTKLLGESDTGSVISFPKKEEGYYFVKYIMTAPKRSRIVQEVSIKDIGQVSKWKGNVNHEIPIKYLEELIHYFKALGIEY